MIILIMVNLRMAHYNSYYLLDSVYSIRITALIVELIRELSHRLTAMRTY